MRVLKDMVGYLFLLAIYAVILGTVIWMYVNFFHSSDKVEAEQIILEKQSEKGMFLAPRYKVITDDSTVGNYVTKKEFDEIDIGDIIEGHKTLEYGFFTKMDQIYDGALLIILIVFFGFMVILMLVTIILTIPPIEEALEKREKHQPQKGRKSIVGWGILIMLLLAGMTYISLFTLNLFHKLVPINQTAATGVIIDRDYDVNIKPQADYSKYELTIEFTAEDGGKYQVQKGVTRATYDLYKYENLIDIQYRNKNPYDIFIKTQSGNEIAGAVMNVSTLIYGLCLFIFYTVTKKWWNNRYSKLEDEEELGKEI